MSTMSTMNHACSRHASPLMPTVALLAPLLAAAPAAAVDGAIEDAIETAKTVRHRPEVVLTTPEGWTLVAGERAASHGTLSTWAVRSPDGGATWEPALLPALASRSIIDLAAFGEELLAVVQWSVEGPGDLVVLASADVGASWAYVGEVPRPNHTATPTDIRWLDASRGTVRLTWQDPGDDRCRFGDLETSNGGRTWTAGQPGECGPGGSVKRLHRDHDSRWRVVPSVSDVEDHPVQATSEGRTLTLRVPPLEAGGVYGYVRRGADVVEVASGAPLRTLQVMQARLDTDASGRLRATVGARDGVVDCAPGGSVPPLLVSVWVEPADLLRVTPQSVRMDGSDGTQLTLDQGAILDRDAAGAVSYRFEKGFRRASSPVLPLRAGIAAVSDRFEVEGPPLPRGESAAEAALAAQGVASWGRATLLGVALDLAPPAGQWGSYPLGGWEFAVVEGTTATVEVGCAVATLRVGEGFNAGGSLGLGMFAGGLWPGASAMLKPGVRLTDPAGAWVATVSARVAAPGAAGFGLGSLSPPEDLSDGRRCEAVAYAWLERADGSPWLLCTR